MPVDIEIPLDRTTLEPPRKRWTRAECAALESTGLLDQQSLELVEGELINRMGKKRSHVNSFTLVLEWLIRTFGARFVNVEAPIDVAPEDNLTSEPQPDAIILKRANFPSANPGPEDLHLVVEIADSSLGFGPRTKAALYARAGIAEYWVLDVAGRRLLVHREPRSGQYASVAAYSEDESVVPLSAPHAAFRVADAFPEPTQPQSVL